jgi:hypothetical protein
MAHRLESYPGPLRQLERECDLQSDKSTADGPVRLFLPVRVQPRGISTIPKTPTYFEARTRSSVEMIGYASSIAYLCSDGL